MRIDHNSPLDEGLGFALKLKSTPKDGLVLELGCGSAHNTLRLAKRGYICEAYDLAPEMLEDGRRHAVAYGNKVKFILRDILRQNFPAKSVSIAIVGTTPYWSKSRVFEYVKKLWRSIKVNGILHIEFVTTKDAIYTSEFFLMTCKPFPEKQFPESYLHHCGFNCAIDHPGVIGTSFWELNQIIELLNTLPGCNLIHKQLREWKQSPVGEEQLLRSFWLLTCRKIR